MKKILTALFAILLIASLSVTAFAETGILQSGIDLIRETGDQDEIIKPSYHSYFETAQLRYIDAPKNHSVYVYKGLDTDIDKPDAKEYLMPFAYEGQMILEVAREQGMSCIIYHDRNFRQHAGWVETRYLTEVFPGKEATVGQTSAAGTAAEVPALKWSKESFSGTNEKFVNLAEAVRGCAQLKLAYQVTDTDGVRFEDMLGWRTVYIHDGSGWIRVGQFEYNQQGTVLVTVNLSEATRVEAIAIIASCNEPGHVISRVELQGLKVQG